MTYKDGSHGDCFPVEGPEETDELNRRYNGDELEKAFPRRYLIRTNGQLGRANV